MKNNWLSHIQYLDCIIIVDYAVVLPVGDCITNDYRKSS